MIRLQKLPDSDPMFGLLIRTLEAHRIAYRAARAAGVDTRTFETAYRAVKPAVAHESSYKCAYCECKVNDTYPGDVEHILPKARDPERTLDYNNLTYVCSLCNNKKRDREFFDGLGLLNPYEDDPEAYVRFFGTALAAVPRDPGRVRGKRTIDDIGLNRTGVLESRAQTVRMCELLELAYHNAGHPAVRELTKQQIREALQADKEHSSLAKAYFLQAGITV